MWSIIRELVADGVTIFLTTQYLEEADILADRIGIIDRGRIVATGTPESLKAEIGRPTLEVTPVEPSDRGTVESVLSRFGSAAPAAPEAAAVRLSGGAEELAAVVRALDAEDVAMRDFQLHAPTLDDVFLAKTGRKLDAGDEEGTGEHAEAVPA
jgi:ABC-2 type transport system ATP-binding protein